jgi:hypothetical protein
MNMDVIGMAADAINREMKKGKEFNTRFTISKRVKVHVAPSSCHVESSDYDKARIAVLETEKEDGSKQQWFFEKDRAVLNDEPIFRWTDFQGVILTETVVEQVPVDPEAERRKAIQDMIKEVVETYEEN